MCSLLFLHRKEAECKRLRTVFTAEYLDLRYKKLRQFCNGKLYNLCFSRHVTRMIESVGMRKHSVKK